MVSVTEEERMFVLVLLPYSSASHFAEGLVTSPFSSPSVSALLSFALDTALVYYIPPAPSKPYSIVIIDSNTVILVS